MNLAYVIDRIEAKNGRLPAAVKRRLTQDLTVWMNQECRRRNFWFLRVQPTMPGVFPVDETTPDTTLFPSETFARWFSGGWMATKANVGVYPYAYPSEVILSVLSNSDGAALPTPQANLTGWMPAEIGRLLSVKQFDYSGTFRKDLPYLPEDEFASSLDYSETGEPIRVTFHTGNGVSRIQFSPVPDDVYVYRVSVLLATFPPLLRPDSTNTFLASFPEAFVQAGLYIAADYQGEQQEMLKAAMALYGMPWAQAQDIDSNPGGIIGAVIQEGRRKVSTGKPQVGFYKSSKQAIGRQQRTRVSGPGWWYEGT